MLAATWGTGEALWSIFWFFLFLIWLMLLFNVVGDLLRDRKLSGVAKVIWLLVLLIVPYLGVFAYLIIRGSAMHDNAVETMKANEAAVEGYIRNVAGTSPADELSRLADLRDKGVIDEAEFTRLKQRIVG